MKTNRFILILFLVVALIQLFVPIKMIFDQQDILSTGTIYKFKMAPVDPYDAFRGKYVTLGFDETFFETDTLTIWKAGEKCYVQFILDENGFVKIIDVTKDKPDQDIPYVKAEIDYTFFGDDKQNLNIQYPFNKFFMEENKAPAAEIVYSNSLADSSSMAYAVVVISKGNAVLKDVMIDGVSLVELAERELENNKKSDYPTTEPINQ